MRKLFYSILFILGSLFAVDRIGGMGMWWVNQHTHDVTGPKLKYLVNDVHEDVLLIGTSRCNLHYVPSIISDTIGMSVYNGGVDASDNIFSHYIILNHVLAHHIPKVICLEVMTNDFDTAENSFNTISFFAPYFGQNTGADSVFLEAGKYWRYKISHLYRFNSKSISNIVGLAVNRHDGGDNGYIPVPQPSHYPDSLVQESPAPTIDMKKIEYLHRFINKCRTKGIKLVFMVSPKYSIVGKHRYDPLKTIAQQHNIPFLDYHTRGMFHKHPDYFKDFRHLWDKGARIYSSIFAGDLKRIISSGI